MTDHQWQVADAIKEVARALELDSGDVSVAGGLLAIATSLHAVASAIDRTHLVTPAGGGRP